MINMPYFMTNKEWFTEDSKTGETKLTEKAPPEAVKSFKKYKALLKKSNVCFKDKNGTWHYAIIDYL